MNIFIVIGLILFFVFIFTILAVFIVLMKIISNLSAKVLQMEIVKKSKNFTEAISVGETDIETIQKINKKKIKKAEIEKIKAENRPLTQKEKEELEWENGVG